MYICFIETSSPLNVIESLNGYVGQFYQLIRFLLGDLGLHVDENEAKECWDDGCKHQASREWFTHPQRIHKPSSRTAVCWAQTAGNVQFLRRKTVTIAAEILSLKMGNENSHLVLKQDSCYLNIQINLEVLQLTGCCGKK